MTVLCIMTLSDSCNCVVSLTIAEQTTIIVIIIVHQITLLLKLVPMFYQLAHMFYQLAPMFYQLAPMFYQLAYCLRDLETCKQPIRLLDSYMLYSKLWYILSQPAIKLCQLVHSVCCALHYTLMHVIACIT